MPTPTPPPVPVQTLQYASVASPSGDGVWRLGEQLVAPREVDLPAGCVRCGRAEVKRYRKTVYWHEPWVYALILPGVLVYAIVAMAIRKKATYSCGLCEMHVRRRGMGLIAMTSAGALGVFMVASGMMGGNGAFGPELRDPSLVFMLLGFLVLIIAFVLLIATLPILRPKKIDEQFAYYHGASGAYLAPFTDLVTGPPGQMVQDEHYYR